MRTDIDPALEALARRGGAAAHLEPAEVIRVRGDRRHRRRSLGAAAAAAVAVVAVAVPLALQGGGATLNGDVATPGPSQTEATEEPGARDPGDQLYVLQAIDDRWLAPGVEGELTLVADRTANPLPTGLRLEPVGDDEVRFVTEATAGPDPMCLRATAEVVVQETCDDSADQRFSIFGEDDDDPTAVQISSRRGVLHVGPDEGQVLIGGPGSPEARGESPSVEFSLIPVDDSSEPALTGPAFDLQAYDDRWLVPADDGGVTTVADRDDSPLPTGYRTEAVGDRRVRLVAEAPGDDGRAQCLVAARGADELSLRPCGDDRSGERFDLTMGGGDGFPIAASDGGLLHASADPDDHRVLLGSDDYEDPTTVFRYGS